MKKSAAALFIGASLACQAGLITDSTARLYGPYTQQTCDTGNVSGPAANCGVSSGVTVTASSQATASYGSVSASVEGGAGSRGYTASAAALSSFTDMLTISGGTGTGLLAIGESSVHYGTGSLGEISQGPWPQSSTVIESFTYGTPFALSLTASAWGNFDWSQGDSGTLLVEKSITSLTVEGSGLRNLSFSDTSGTDYNFGVSGGGFAATANFAAAPAAPTPEPDSWVMAVIGVALVLLGRRRIVPGKELN